MELPSSASTPRPILYHKERWPPIDFRRYWQGLSHRLEIGSPGIESDRARFLSRGRDARTAACMLDDRRLSGRVGTVLDPIVSLRQRLAIPRGRTARIVFTTLVAPSRSEALEIAEKYRQPATF